MGAGVLGQGAAETADSLGVGRLVILGRPAILGTGVLIVLAAAVLASSQLWITMRGRPFVYTAIDEVPTREMAIVPGVGGSHPGRPGACLLPRLRAALALYRAHKVQSILVSGVGDHSSTDEVVEMRRWLESRGVAVSDIVADPSGHRTLDTMWRASNLLGVRSAIVCTQAPFINRTLFLARGVGIDAVGLVAPSVAFPQNAWRLDALKVVLALADIYVLHRQARHTDVKGVVDGRVLMVAHSD